VNAISLRSIETTSVPQRSCRAFVAMTSSAGVHGQNSVVGKILEIHQETPGRIHVVLIRQVVGF
jgi:hypothetical protein